MGVSVDTGRRNRHTVDLREIDEPSKKRLLTNGFDHRDERGPSSQRVYRRLDLDALRPKKDDQPADRQRRYKVIAFANSVSEKQDRVTLQGTGIIQYRILLDVRLDFALRERTKEISETSTVDSILCVCECITASAVTNWNSPSDSSLRNCAASSRFRGFS